MQPATDASTALPPASRMSSIVCVTIGLWLEATARLSRITCLGPCRARSSHATASEPPAAPIASARASPAAPPAATPAIPRPAPFRNLRRFWAIAASIQCLLLMTRSTAGSSTRLVGLAADAAIKTQDETRTVLVTVVVASRVEERRQQVQQNACTHRDVAEQ